jgi:cytoskeletal protein CcmA (bactofilin family)
MINLVSSWFRFGLRKILGGNVAFSELGQPAIGSFSTIGPTIKEGHDPITVNILGVGSSLVGNVDTDSDYRVDGKLVGNIVTSKSLVVGPTGVVLGNVIAEKIVISGRISGDYHASSVTVIGSTGSYQGTLTTKRIRIDLGASVLGRITAASNSTKPSEGENSGIPRYQIGLNYSRRIV